MQVDIHRFELYVCLAGKEIPIEVVVLSPPRIFHEVVLVAVLIFYDSRHLHAVIVGRFPIVKLLLAHLLIHIQLLDGSLKCNAYLVFSLIDIERVVLPIYMDSLFIFGLIWTKLL